MKNARLIAFGDFVSSVNILTVQSIHSTINQNRRNEEGGATEVWIVTLVSGAMYEIDKSGPSNEIFVPMRQAFRDAFMARWKR